MKLFLIAIFSVILLVVCEPQQELIGGEDVLDLLNKADKSYGRNIDEVDGRRSDQNKNSKEDDESRDQKYRKYERDKEEDIEPIKNREKNDKQSNKGENFENDYGKRGESKDRNKDSKKIVNSDEKQYDEKQKIRNDKSDYDNVNTRNEKNDDKYRENYNNGNKGENYRNKNRESDTENTNDKNKQKTSNDRKNKNNYNSSERSDYNSKSENQKERNKDSNRGRLYEKQYKDDNNKGEGDKYSNESQEKNRYSSNSNTGPSNYKNGKSYSLTYGEDSSKEIKSQNSGRMNNERQKDATFRAESDKYQNKAQERSEDRVIEKDDNKYYSSIEKGQSNSRGKSYSGRYRDDSSKEVTYQNSGRTSNERYKADSFRGENNKYVNKVQESEEDKEKGNRYYTRSEIVRSNPQHNGKSYSENYQDDSSKEVTSQNYGQMTNEKNKNFDKNIYNNRVPSKPYTYLESLITAPIANKAKIDSEYEKRYQKYDTRFGKDNNKNYDKELIIKGKRIKTNEENKNSEERSEEKNYREGFINYLNNKKDASVEILDFISNIGQEIKEQVIEKIPGYNIIQNLAKNNRQNNFKEVKEKDNPKIDLEVYYKPGSDYNNKEVAKNENVYYDKTRQYENMKDEEKNINKNKERRINQDGGRHDTDKYKVNYNNERHDDKIKGHVTITSPSKGTDRNDEDFYYKKNINQNGLNKKVGEEPSNRQKVTGNIGNEQVQSEKNKDSTYLNQYKNYDDSSVDYKLKIDPIIKPSDDENNKNFNDYTYKKNKIYNQRFDEEPLNHYVIPSNNGNTQMKLKENTETYESNKGTSGAKAEVNYTTENVNDDNRVNNKEANNNNQDQYYRQQSGFREPVSRLLQQSEIFKDAKYYNSKIPSYEYYQGQKNYDDYYQMKNNFEGLKVAGPYRNSNNFDREKYQSVAYEFDRGNQVVNNDKERLKNYYNNHNEPLRPEIYKQNGKTVDYYGDRFNDYDNDKNVYEILPKKGWPNYNQKTNLYDNERSKYIEYRNQEYKNDEGYDDVRTTNKRVENDYQVKSDYAYSEPGPYMNMGHFGQQYFPPIAPGFYNFYYPQQYPGPYIFPIQNPLTQQILGSAEKYQDLYYNQNSTQTKTTSYSENKSSPYLKEYRNNPQNFENSNVNRYRDSYDTKSGYYDTSYQSSNNEYSYQYQLPYARVYFARG